MGEKPQSPEEDLGGVASHPLRRRILDYLSAHEASPSDMAIEFGLDVEDVSYHVRRLRDMGAICLVDQTPVRGAVKHTYRARIEAQSTLARSVTLSRRERARNGQLIAELAAADVAAALRAGSLGSGASDRFARLGGLVDDEALAEVREIQLQAERQIVATLTQAKSRVGESEERSLRFIRVVTMSLQVPEPDVPLE